MATLSICAETAEDGGGRWLIRLEKLREPPQERVTRAERVDSAVKSSGGRRNYKPKRHRVADHLDSHISNRDDRHVGRGRHGGEV